MITWVSVFTSLCLSVWSYFTNVSLCLCSTLCLIVLSDWNTIKHHMTINYPISAQNELDHTQSVQDRVLKKVRTVQGA